MTGGGVERSAPRTPATARMAPMLTTGLDGASSTTSAESIASVDAGAGGGLVGADEGEAVGRAPALR